MNKRLWSFGDMRKKSEISKVSCLILYNTIIYGFEDDVKRNICTNIRYYINFTMKMIMVTLYTDAWMFSLVQRFDDEKRCGMQSVSIFPTFFPAFLFHLETNQSFYSRHHAVQRTAITVKLSTNTTLNINSKIIKKNWIPIFLLI